MLKDSLYEKYLGVRCDGQVIEDEHGFIAYRIDGKECFILDMFVDTDHQKKGRGRALIDLLSHIASTNLCSHITANVHLSDKNASSTILSAILVGFKIISANGNILLIAKEVGA